MKGYLEILLLMALLFVMGQVSKVVVVCSEQQDHPGSALNPSERKLRVASYLSGGMNASPLTAGSRVSNRFKRTLKDVEKLMLEDELMAMLICEMCEKHACVPQYCRFCRVECDPSSSSNNGSTFFKLNLI
jgi:hypothetical protein